MALDHLDGEPGRTPYINVVAEFARASLEEMEVPSMLVISTMMEVSMQMLIEAAGLHAARACLTQMAAMLPIENGTIN